MPLRYAFRLAQQFAAVLRNEIARAVALADRQTIARAHLCAALSASGGKDAMPDSPAPLSPSTGDFAGVCNR